MTQKIVALFALVFVFSFFNSYAEEVSPAPVPQPPVVAAPATGVVSAPIPMPGLSDMVNVTPRMFLGVCPNQIDLIFFEGYNKKGNEDSGTHDARRYFLNDESAPYLVLVFEGEGKDKKLAAYLDVNRDGIADLVTDIDDPLLKANACVAARLTMADLTPPPTPEPPAAAVPAPATPSPQPKTE